MARKAVPDSTCPAFQSLYAHGFVRVGAAAPVVALADPVANGEAILAFARAADAEKAAILLTPELSVSGYSLDDLFLQDALLAAAETALARLKRESADLFTTLIVGAPIKVDSAIYNCAVIMRGGRVLGVVPKSFLPNYREYYEKRYFAMAPDAAQRVIRLCGEEVPFGADLVFAAEDAPDFIFHVEICEDIWSPTPPSTLGALAGATVLLNLSASNITIGKAEDRAVLVNSQSRRCAGAYLLAASGYGESTTDVAWDGQVIAYELGEKIAEAERFTRTPSLTIADIDVEKLAQERRRLSNFRDAMARNKDALQHFRRVTYTLDAPLEPLALKRPLRKLPFVPDDPTHRDSDCFEAYNIQVSGLTRRLEATDSKRVVIGISGGLDSTHALIVAARAFDLLGRDRKEIVAVTLPGFATSEETKANAWALMRALKIDAREYSIAALAQTMLEGLNHPAATGEPVYDITYENVQAGLRTDYLFRLANKEGGLVLGTGDLSESALGWQTYGVGDHMSHYNVNAGAPKTLIQHLIRWVVAKEIFDETASQTLLRVLDTEITPELVPGGQRTESTVGPYELQDFNLYWLTRFGLKPSKVLFMAWSAWRDTYSYEEIRHWLGVFLKRFFAAQFKRSAMPNGPKLVSGGALSPRGDWRAPSDARATTWLQELEQNSPAKLD